MSFRIIFSENFIKRSPPIAPRYVSPFTINAPPIPIYAITNPPKLGPITLAELNTPALRAIADESAFFSTISLENACRAGASIAKLSPNKNAKTTMCSI
ncbi:hypothetical protein A3G67_02090 [Candidatus Roizmanbacteria bacterium RIFCSPLOWO2_12_FULL_40_12]|uniref:Uncharacterized protein n=1 Tax=Candidatus Roizmanbacteria bacterium RIFCSPLOWO2_01_FULL_40_42 TaxID=1802066 RepID=A0A1F7J3L8_9BACT|nr:MAG: hypothetical protein A2779_01210 [Candidatus Roizmanbacteria bacterium RIFCSPHIGHO2_01_FULL_40_98]OGK28983.1 MAG: hypothetical protein A3C31_01850 [Candidatus Roizmanbacteria bacterium RIFCSPHIGHO2_02_FULL_40_53]OGK29551.1 MAG: hypothetical protein A2W49_03690 [Candidatus Roizmanbacteria bacterium RIFCSPHIGHO2_12_41_18]OGK37270.1 MAG: hypothetical protein A3E69_04150 [Candidatus Roizmanbacteria bacterium RIFCSPHIGHO2_12_FULL_40_130]OGK50212.1 MAG: hypothetical protein A3B50_00305 [Candi